MPPGRQKHGEIARDPLDQVFSRRSLRNGNWVKVICGASFEDVVDIRNLSLVYTLAGVDCIDCAADESVVNALNQGIEAAREIVEVGRPWVMISVNDDKDLHFCKAEFDPADCPQDCSRPCEIVCPANAISLEKEKSSAGRLWNTSDKGVHAYVRDAAATYELLRREDIDASEIHTSGRQVLHFRSLWEGLGDAIRRLRLVARYQQGDGPDIDASSTGTVVFWHWQSWTRNCKGSDGATRILSGILGQTIAERMGIILMPSNHPKTLGLESLSETLYCLRYVSLNCHASMLKPKLMHLTI